MHGRGPAESEQRGGSVTRSQRFSPRRIGRQAVSGLLGLLQGAFKTPMSSGLWLLTLLLLLPRLLGVQEAAVGLGQSIGGHGLHLPNGDGGSGPPVERIFAYAQCATRRNA
jgi:hypothetical protein